MHQSANVVLVSNRPPVSFARRPDGGFDLRRGAGGVAGALDPVARSLGGDAVWIALATSEDDRVALRGGAADDLLARLGYPVHLLDFDPALYSRYYDEVANRMLWFAAHGLWDEIGNPAFGPEATRSFEDAYEMVNRDLAEAVVAASAPGALVLLQDYHLATAASHLRIFAPDRIVLHFTHTPFPAPEISKNIVRGFEAWSRLLDRRADLRGARFVACVYPTRSGMKEYRDYAERINDAARRADDRHPGSVELYFGDDFDRTLGAYRIYDVLLVNSIMDGLNLVSMEGPAINERNGALVLSRGAGSFEQIGDYAVAIDDPLDVDATATALERALELEPAERSRRAAAIRRAVTETTPGDWVRAQMDDLTRIGRGDEPATPAPRVGR